MLAVTRVVPIVPVVVLLLLVALLVVQMMLVPHSFKGLIRRLEMRKWKTNPIEEILVSNSSLVSGLSEASGVRFTWVEIS